MAPMFDRLGRPYTPMMDPARRVGRKPANAGKRYPAELLSSSEVLRLLAACGEGPNATRNRALIVVMWRAGLRVAEALALQPRDIDVVAGELNVRHGKGNQRRLVGMDPRAMRYLEQWLAVRALLVGERAWTGAVFCTTRAGNVGHQISSAYVREMLKHRGAQARIAKRAHPHGLRHTNAMELMREGVPVRLIQRHLGHNDLATTARYLDHLYPREAIERMHRRRWPQVP